MKKPKTITFVSVGEVADWLMLTEKQVQNLEKEGVVVKAGRGSYDLKGSVQRRLQQLEERKNESPLVRKQIENLEIKNKREMMELLQDWGVVTQDDALAHELVPVFKSFQVAMRELPTTLAKQLWDFVKATAPELAEGKKTDQEGVAAIRELLAGPLDERLRMLAVLNDWGKRRENAISR